MFSISQKAWFRLLAIFVLVVSSVGSVASAQQADRPWREVRTIEMAEYGLSNLEGLTFSPDANAFLLWSADGSVAGIGMSEVPVDTQGLVISADDPQNIAFDGSTDKLFVLGNDDTQLDEIPVDGEGLPAPQASSIRKHNLDAVNLQSARGLTFDPETGRMFVLNAEGDQLVVVEPDESSTFDGDAAVREGRVTRISLSGLGAADLQSIAFNPQNGNLYFLDAGDQRLYEVTQSGDKLSEFDLSSLQITNPKNIVFAPSGDRTDDPENQSLFLLHESQITGLVGPASPQTASADGELVEISLVAPMALPGGTQIRPASLVRTQDMSNAKWSPSSPDSSGIDYWPQFGGFLVTDSEVDEEGYWVGVNVFGATTSGTQLSNCTTHTPSGGSSWNNYTNEPTGIGINPNTNRIYITTDGGNGRYFEINIGPDNTYCTADDVVTPINLTTDLEDVAYGNNKLFFAGGIDSQIYYFDLGANQVVGGGDDSAMQNFDTARWGFNDMEGIGFNTDTGNILIHGYMGSGVGYVAEVSTAGGGTLLWAYDVSFMGNGPRLHSDITYAPSSQNGALKNVYIVSRGVDNAENANENDGKWWEINIGEASTPLTVTGITAANKVYDGTSAAIINTGSATLNGVTPGDQVTLVTAGASGAFVNATVGNGKTVNISGLTLSGANAGSYTLIQPTTTASITKAPLTVTADNKSKIAGQPDPAFTFTYSGFVNAETSAVLDTPPACGVSGPHNTPGTYPIVCSGGVDNNYSFTYVNGTLTVTVNPETAPDLGPDTTGVFRPSNGLLYLKNKNETGFADIGINYGIPGDYPVVGDWDGDGDTTIGVYRNGSFYLRNSNTIGVADVVFPFGAPGDQPVAGDWNGDGVDTIGVYRNGTFFLRNSNGPGAPDFVFVLGNPGDVAIAGDWNGNGVDTAGVFRPSNGALYLKNTNATGFADIQINYGIPGDKPVTGDWNNDGTDTIGIYRNGTFYLRNTNTVGFADIVFALGNPGDHPIAGNWDGKP
jgi:hypothetical protein